MGNHVKINIGPAPERSLSTPEVFPIVAHELSQPLTAALGGAITIKEFPDVTADQKVMLLDGVIRNLKHLAALLSNLDAFARIDSGKLEISRGPVVVKKLFEEFVGDYSGRAERIFKVDCPPDLAIEVDPHLFRQVLYNLLNNAKKFSPRGALISLEARQDDREIRLVVANEGEGFEQEWSEHIFRKAARLSDRRGLGLGLYVAKVVVDAHGGRIWAESKPGAGAKFVVALPAANGG